MARAALDLAGKRFGDLEVIRRTGIAPNGASLWECRCHACGGTAILVGYKITDKRNPKIDCGCRKRKLLEDLTGKQFGNLLVISSGGVSRSGDRRYLCECLLCGNQKEYNASTLRTGKLNSCGCTRYNHDRMKEMSGRGLEKTIIDGINVPYVLREEANANSKTGLRGVYFDARRRSYTATCQVKGEKWIKCGFPSKESAKKARDEKHKEMVERYNVKPLRED